MEKHLKPPSIVGIARWLLLTTHALDEKRGLKRVRARSEKFHFFVLDVHDCVGAALGFGEQPGATIGLKVPVPPPETMPGV